MLIQLIRRTVHGFLLPESSRSKRQKDHEGTRHECVKTRTGGSVEVVTWDKNRNTNLKERKLWIYIHGRSCSASQSFEWDDGRPDIMTTLAQYGTVYGVNLPGYENSTLTDNDITNAEFDTYAAAMSLKTFFNWKAEELGIQPDDIAIVSVSVGAFLASQLMLEMLGVRSVYITPLANLAKVKYGYLPSWLVSRTVKAASLTGRTHREFPEYDSVGFDTVRVLEAALPTGNPTTEDLVVFQAEDDEIMPKDSARQIVNAAGRGRIAELDDKNGHRSKLSEKELREICESWSWKLEDTLPT